MTETYGQMLARVELMQLHVDEGGSLKCDQEMLHYIKHQAGLIEMAREALRKISPPPHIARVDITDGLRLAVCENIAKQTLAGLSGDKPV